MIFFCIAFDRPAARPSLSAPFWPPAASASAAAASPATAPPAASAGGGAVSSKLRSGSRIPCAALRRPTCRSHARASISSAPLRICRRASRRGSSGRHVCRSRPCASRGSAGSRLQLLPAERAASHSLHLRSQRPRGLGGVGYRACCAAAAHAAWRPARPVVMHVYQIPQNEALRPAAPRRALLLRPQQELRPRRPGSASDRSQASGAEGVCGVPAAWRRRAQPGGLAAAGARAQAAGTAPG